MKHVRRSASRGFTLTELAVVVVIVGVLATLSVIGFRKLANASKVNEATENVMKIQMAQEHFKAVNGQYANLSPNLDTTYPAASPAAYRTAWGAPCGAKCNTGREWTELTLRIEEPVMFGYATMAGLANEAVRPASITVDGKTVTFPSTPQIDWYTIGAKGDTDANGSYCRVYKISFNRDIFVDAEGE